MPKRYRNRLTHGRCAGCGRVIPVTEPAWAESRQFYCCGCGLSLLAARAADLAAQAATLSRGDPARLEEWLADVRRRTGDITERS
jgi:hypothetical protein